MFDTSWIGPSIQSLDAARQQWWNYQEARHVERFNERQTDTAMQRRVADLRAAGLNPILAADGGGAASASGVAAPGVAADIGGAISSALSMKRLNADIEQINQNIENMKAQKGKTEADTRVSDSQKTLTDQLLAESQERTRQLQVQTRGLQAGIPQKETMGTLWSIPLKIKDYLLGNTSSTAKQNASQGNTIKDFLKDTTFGQKLEEGSFMK